MHRRVFLAAVALTCSSVFTGAQAVVPRTLRIYLARHGESVANAHRTLAGQSDVPLTERGRKQAQELGATLSGIRFDAVYSSTLSRSRVTAEIATMGKGGVESLADLRERSLGRFEGKPIDDPEYLRRSRNPEDELDGGESLSRFLERVRLAFEQIQRAHPSGTILIVGHLDTNRMILRILLNLTADQANAIVQSNDELYALDVTEGQGTRLWKLIQQKNLGDL